MRRGEPDRTGHAAPTERSHAFTAIFAELRHAAAAVRATRESTELAEYEQAYHFAWSAWAETRERTAEALGALHAAQNERLLVRCGARTQKRHEVHAPAASSSSGEVHACRRGGCPHRRNRRCAQGRAGGSAGRAAFL